MTKTNPFSEFLDQPVPPILVGRDDILRKIFRDLGNQQLRAYEVAAVAHVGSSALLKYLADTQQLFTKGDKHLHRGINRNNYCPVYVDGRSAFDDMSVAEWLLEGILETPIAQEMISKSGFKQTKRPMRDLTLLLKKARRSQIIVFFLIDHFDQRFTSLDTNESVNLRGLTNHASFLIAAKRPLSKLNQNAFASWFGSVTTRIDLPLLEQNQKRELIQACLNTEEIEPQQISSYAAATSIAGMHPSFILLACQELFELKESLFGIDEEIIHNLLKDRLTAVFQPRFSYYHRHLEKEYRDSLANLIGNQVTYKKDYLNFMDLERLGLLISHKGPKGVKHAPFSELFQNYLEIESSIKPAGIKIKGDFTPLHKQILQLMIASPNQVIPYADFLKKVWQKEEVDDKNLRLLRETIRNLKKNMVGKIEGEIFNHRSVGYEYRTDDQ